MASILGGELVRRLGGRADAFRLCVGGLPGRPTPPFHYQLVFSVEGLLNEYVEPARILRKGKLTTIDPLTEPEASVRQSTPGREVSLDAMMSKIFEGKFTSKGPGCASWVWKHMNR